MLPPTQALRLTLRWPTLGLGRQKLNLSQSILTWPDCYFFYRVFIVSNNRIQTMITQIILALGIPALNNAFSPCFMNNICDRPRENRPSSHLGMIVEIPILKVVISITSFWASFIK